MFQYECITGFEEVGRQDSRLRLSISGGRGEEGKRTASQDSREVCFGMLCDCLILYACRPDALYMLLEMKESGSLCTTHLGVHMRREVEGSHLGKRKVSELHGSSSETESYDQTDYDNDNTDEID